MPVVGAQTPAGNAANRPTFVEGELLVKFKQGATANAQATAHASAQSRVVREIRGVKVVQVPRQAQQQLSAYQRNPNVELVELNGIAYPDMTPSDSMYPQQWGLNNTGQTGGAKDKDIDAPEAWNTALGGATIAIVDTGIREDHPDLAGKVVDRWNWFDGTSTTDVYGHGTHVPGSPRPRTMAWVSSACVRTARC